MLVNLSKNQFLYDWMRDKWEDEIFKELIDKNFNWFSSKDDIKNIKIKLAQFLSNKGYQSKVTSRNDIIIAISEEEFVWNKLKYE